MAVYGIENRHRALLGGARRFVWSKTSGPAHVMIKIELKLECPELVRGQRHDEYDGPRGRISRPRFSAVTLSVTCISDTTKVKEQKLTTESQEPVHKLMPSLLTPKQLTLFSWPTSAPTFSPRVISQT